jgi:hypothetical protein
LIRWSVLMRPAVKSPGEEILRSLARGLLV